MSVTVVLEENAEPPYERCCFCRKPTPYWYFPGGVENKKPLGNNEVACCLLCAKEATVKDMPSKRTWCRREDIIAKGEGRFTR